MEYLFIRILEACNAGCWFCNFASSKDSFRLGMDEYKEILEECKKDKIKYIRFTGGEPLLHTDIDKFILLANEYGIKTSIITNGFLLPQKIDDLADCGLDQIIISIDDLFEKHDNNRKIVGLFEKTIIAIKKAKSRNIKVRINSVIGPHNFRNLKKMQDLFTELKVDYWEASALKLNKKIEYGEVSEEIEKIISEVYYAKNKIIPYGKIWCGNTIEEKRRYFEESIPPLANEICYMPERIRFYDAKNRNLFVCSLLPHRDLDDSNYRHFDEKEKFVLYDDKINNIIQKYKFNSCSLCKGCSSTAAYLGEKDMDYPCKEWEY